MLFDPLETERGTKSDSQVVMRAIGEVNLVASLQAQANWAPESLDATARVEGYVRITHSDVTHLGGKFGLVAEVYEAPNNPVNGRTRVVTKLVLIPLSNVFVTLRLKS